MQTDDNISGPDQQRRIMYVEVWHGQDGRRGFHHEGVSVFLGAVIVSDDLKQLPFRKLPNTHAFVVCTLRHRKGYVAKIIRLGTSLLLNR